MASTLEEDFGATPTEGRGDVEDEGKVDFAAGINIAPGTLEEHRRQALGEMVGFLEAGRDDKVALEVDISEQAVAFDKGEAVIVYVFVAFASVVAVFDGEDNVSQGVDNAEMVSDADKCASEFEGAHFVVGAGNDLTAAEVEESHFVVA